MVRERVNPKGLARFYLPLWDVVTDRGTPPSSPPANSPPMPITYIVDRPAGYIVETWTGTIGVEDLSAHWKLYLADADVRAVRRTLLDMRAATVAFSGSDLSRAIAAIVVPALRGLDCRSAIVVANAVQFGTSRQYQVFADHYSKDAILMTSRRDWSGD